MKSKPGSKLTQTSESLGPRVRLRGPSGFEAFYEREFGTRWLGLREAIWGRAERSSEGRVIRENGFARPETRARVFAELPRGPLGATRVFDRAIRADQQDEAGLKLGYVMDPASMLPALALPLDEAQSILDLCAAPGGKALILAERAPENARLTMNDRSPDRTLRLHRVVTDYLPQHVRERTSITRADGRSVGQRHPRTFDAILLDAPCSSEAHVALDPKALADWSETRVQRLAKDQYALLTSALDASATNGFVVYSTCALSSTENDGVIRRLVARGRHGAKVISLPEPALGERTEFGIRVLPDRHGFGPIYYCLLTKV